MAEPNPPVQPARTRAFICCGCTCSACGSVRLTGGLGSWFLAASRSPALSRRKLRSSRVPRAARARRLAPSARAPLRAAACGLVEMPPVTPAAPLAEHQLKSPSS